MTYMRILVCCISACMFISQAFASPALPSSQSVLRSAADAPESIASLTADEELPFVPDEVIIKYRLSDVPSRRPRRVKRRNKNAAALIAQKFKLRLRKRNSYRPVHPAHVERMDREGLNERELRQKNVARIVAKRPKLARARRKALNNFKDSNTDYGTSRRLVLQLAEGESVKQAVKRLKQNKGIAQDDIVIEEATPNYIYNILFTPNDPLLAQQWGLSAINAFQAWDTTIGDSDPETLIAVIDTVDYNHLDLAANIWSNSQESVNGIDDDGNGFIDDIRGWDFVAPAMSCAVGEDCNTRDNNPMDFHGHGTHCSGIVAAQADNNRGIAGVCPGCLIMPLRAGYKDTSGDGRLALADILDATQYAIDHGADVISMSIGGTGSSAYTSMMQQAHDAGIILIAAAGNDSSKLKQYPAADPHVLSVASVTSSLDLSYFSN